MKTHTVWKYVLKVTNVQEVNVPLGAKVLSAMEQCGQICLWCLVDSSCLGKELCPVWIHGTGHTITDAVSKGRFVSSVPLEGGQLIFHIFVGKAF
jgi:hypothetical protein